MNKAILVLNEMPDKCGNCPCLQQWYDDEHEEWYEMCFYRYCKIENTESKLNICPLKPLPQKKLPNGSDIFNDYVRGYNDCIDEILGVENE